MNMLSQRIKKHKVQTTIFCSFLKEDDKINKYRKESIHKKFKSNDHNTINELQKNTH